VAGRSRPVALYKIQPSPNVPSTQDRSVVSLTQSWRMMAVTLPMQGAIAYQGDLPASGGRVRTLCASETRTVAHSVIGCSCCASHAPVML
jgi:hypothetical protein